MSLQAVFLICTIKPDDELSHTEVLSELLAEKLQAHDVESELLRLADKNIKFGLYNNMGEGDEWPPILEKILKADIIIFATPIWWGTQSSVMQKVLERMNKVRTEEFFKRGASPLSNKVGGIVITGGEDGAEFIIGHLAKFMTWIGLTLPPMCSVSVLSSTNYKSDVDREELFQEYEEKVGTLASITANNLSATVALLKERPLFPVVEAT